jgi:hypothetical protein
MAEKYAELEKGGTVNPFIDANALGAYVNRMEQAFNTRLLEQQQGKLPPAGKGKAKGK